MKFFLLWTVAIEFALHGDCLPLPAGQIVKYRVPSKFFKQPNVTVQEGSDPLYNFLSQIHFGGTSQTFAINSNEIQSEDFTKDVKSEPEATTESRSTEAPVTHKVMIEPVEMVKVSVQDDNKFSFLALIEKVAQEEIKKLSEEKLPETKSSPTLLNIKIISSTEQEPTVQHTTLLMREEEDTTKLSITTGSMNLDSETILPTNAPAIENEAMKLETMSELETKDTTESLQNRVKAPEEEATTTNSLQHDDNVKKENSASDSLLSAVGDLLSSILGVGSKKTAVVNEQQQNVIPEPDNETVDKAAERVKETVEVTATTATNSLESEASSEVEQGTEKIDETATPVGFEGERIIEMETKKTVETVPVLIAVSQDKDEVELKIENLANAQTSLATENTPEQVTETVREEPSESSNNEPVVLEVISDPSTENEKPVSFEESVNQIMNLVKNSEEHVSDLMSVDDMKEDVSDLELLIYGTMKDVESNLGEDIKTETSEPVFIDLTKSLGTERSKHPFEYDNFVLNSAKAALHDRWEDDVDF